MLTPTLVHQLIVQYLYEAFRAHFAARGGGLVVVAPYRLRLRPGKFREPDLIVLLDARDPRAGDAFAEGADLVVEVVGDENRRHDLETKRAEYAAAGIPEYWIVDPAGARVVVLRLDGPEYAEHGAFGPGDRAASATLDGFSLDVARLLDPRRDDA